MLKKVTEYNENGEPENLVKKNSHPDETFSWHKSEMERARYFVTPFRLVKNIYLEKHTFNVNKWSDQS